MLMRGLILTGLKKSLRKEGLYRCRLCSRNELAAIEDPAERQQLFETMVAKMYEVGKGVSMADHFEIDDVIDPAATRHWITTAFRTTAPAGSEPRSSPFVDTW